MNAAALLYALSAVAQRAIEAEARVAQLEGQCAALTAEVEGLRKKPKKGDADV